MEWEVYRQKIRTFSAEIESGRLKMFRSSMDDGFAVRVIVDKKVGFSSGKNVQKAMEEAKKIAKISEDYLEDFPCEKPTKVDGIYDRSFENLSADYIKEEFEILKSSVEKANIANAFISHEIAEISLENSFGAELHRMETYSLLSLETVYEKGSAYAQCESRKLKLDVASVATYAEELAVKSSKAKEIEEGYYDIVLMPYAVHQLFSHTLYPSLSAENVAKGRSRVEIGFQLGNIRLIDDPTISGGLASYPFDDEGAKARKKILVDRKVLNFYSDWKNSKNFGVAGNGLRLSLDLPPMPMPSNVVIEADEKVEMDSALIVHSIIGAHTANAVSGDFSVEVLNAEFDGKPIRSAMIYGNIFEVLSRVQGFCSKTEQFENTITSALRFHRLRVV
ncbi:MAG: TldD/PmbA family protein [Archaeoglobaceae archaeon]